MIIFAVYLPQGMDHQRFGISMTNPIKKLEERFYRTLIKPSKLRLSKKEKFYFLNLIRAIALAGQDEKRAIESKLEEYRRKQYIPGILIMEKVLRDMGKGKTLVDTLYKYGILTEREYHILKNSRDGLANGIERILEAQKRNQKSKSAFLLMFAPPGLMLLTLYFSQPQVYAIIDKMLEPIRSAGATPPPIPAYMKDPTIYLMGNILYFGALAALFVIVFIVKKYYPKKYLSMFPIVEEEYTYDIIRSLKTVMEGGGLNLTNAAKALSLGEKDNIRKSLFNDIYESIMRGKVKMYEVLEEYSVNYNTVSAVRIGEEAKDLNLGLMIALEDIQKRYERDIAIFMKVAMWSGQLGMLGVAIKPMIDILLIMSVGQLNFKIY